MPGFLISKPEPIIYSSPRAIVKVTLETCLAYKHHVNVSPRRNGKPLCVKRDEEGTENVCYFQIIFICYFFMSYFFFFFFAVLGLIPGAEVSGYSLVVCGFSCLIAGASLVSEHSSRARGLQ